MNGLMDGFYKRHTWPALIGLVLALATGIAAFDTGAYSAPPVAAPRPDLSIDRLTDAAHPPGATDPADHTARPSGDQGERTTSAPPPAPVADPAATARIQQGYGRLPMHFEPNQGQSADAVRYLARGAGYSLFLTDTEAVMVLRKPTASAANRPEAGPAATPARLDGTQRHPGLAGTPANPDPSAGSLTGAGDRPWSGFRYPDWNDTAPPFSLQGVGMPSWTLLWSESLSDAVGAGLNPAPTPEPGSQNTAADPPLTAVVRMRLTGATRNPAPAIAGLERQPGISNYILGNDPAKWRSGVPHYAKVQYDQVYPGIDLVYYGNPQQLEYDLVVAPGADPGQIRLSFEGVDGMRIDGEGKLVLAVAGGEIVQKAPRIYQRVDGQERPVAGRYVVLDEGRVAAAGVDRVQDRIPMLGFTLAGYDRGRALVIDPVVVYSTYLGGSSSDEGTAIAVDGAGNAYVTGWTGSTDFPTVNASYPHLWGFWDAFVTKFDPQGQGPVYSTYLGGSGDDGGLALGIAVDEAGNAYVTGTTYSTDFPTMNARYPKLWGYSDAFVTKLDSRGQGPVYSTYLGGSGREDGTGIAVDGAGNAYVTGATGSTDFPTVNARYPHLWGLYSDAFVTKFDPQGQGPVYSTYLGGSERYYEWGNRIAVDGAGSVYVTGMTTAADFPTVNAPYPTLRGYGDAFVTKLDPQGQGPVYSTYLGGSNGWDTGYGIAVDDTGNAYVTGATDSTDFPTVNALYPTAAGAQSSFVTKFGPQGQGPVYSTYLGSSAKLDQISHLVRGGVAVDGAGNAYVIASTLQGQNNRPSNAFVTKLDPQGQGPVYSIFLGGSSWEDCTGIAIDGIGNAYVTGSTSSVDFPTVNARYPHLWGTSDAFVAKISPAGALDTPEQPVFADTPPLAAAPNLRKYLILLIHGWNSTPSVWAEPMKQTIAKRLNPDYDKDPCVEPIVNGDISWQICSYDWREQAGYKSESDFNFMPGKFPPWDAQVNAGNVGKRLAERLVAGRYDFIHFIAHSAGGNVAESAAAWLRVRIQSYNRSQPQDPISAPIIHSTFFDAYDLAGNNSRYGSASNWAEQYVDSRVVAGGLPDGDQTRNVLPHAYNFDVTNLDPMQDAGLFGTHAHAWPYIWYQFTIDNTGVFKDTGFARSLEWWRDNPPSIEEWLAIRQKAPHPWRKRPRRAKQNARMWRPSSACR